MKQMSLSEHKRPNVTMFMLMSVDGKISTGCNEFYDFDKDLPKLAFTSKGLHQYYELEAETALWTMCSGKTQTKVLNGVPLTDIVKSPASIVVIDSHHLNDYTLERLSHKYERVVVASTRPREFSYTNSNIDIEVFPAMSCEVLPQALLERLYSAYGIKEVCLQGGGTLNAAFIRNDCVDYIDVVVAPLIVGGRTVPSIVDGVNPVELHELRGLSLVDVVRLKHNYIRLIYQVLK